MLNRIVIIAEVQQNLFPEPTLGEKAFNISLFVIGILLVVFYFWMLIDTLVRPIKHKLLWFLVVFFLGPLAAIVYFFTGRKHLKDEANGPAGSPPQESQTPLQS